MLSRHLAKNLKTCYFCHTLTQLRVCRHEIQNEFRSMALCVQCFGSIKLIGKIRKNVYPEINTLCCEIKLNVKCDKMATHIMVHKPTGARVFCCNLHHMKYLGSAEYTGFRPILFISDSNE